MCTLACLLVAFFPWSFIYPLMSTRIAAWQNCAPIFYEALNSLLASVWKLKLKYLRNVARVHKVWPSINLFHLNHNNMYVFNMPTGSIQLLFFISQHSCPLFHPKSQGLIDDSVKCDAFRKFKLYKWRSNLSFTFQFNAHPFLNIAPMYVLVFVFTFYSFF